MKAHPAAELFPMMPDDELDALAEDIKVHGLNQPVVLHEGSILDGRNRSEACRRAGVDPKTVQWRDPGCGPVAWVISQNMHRRHLTAGQKAMLALEVEPMLAAEAKKRQGTRTDIRADLPESRRGRDDAGALVGVSGRSVAKAKRIAREDPEMAERVREGTIALDKAEKSVRMGVHFSSATDEWATPQELFDELNEEFRFTLDVCARDSSAKCAKYFTPNSDGLAQDWSQDVCWMNPPYGSEIVEWVKKAYESSRAGATVVCLVPARVDTNWFFDYCRHGEVRFIKGRLKFGGSPNSAPFPSALVVFKPKSKPSVKWWER